jgi:hypothetical protein
MTRIETALEDGSNIDVTETEYDVSDEIYAGVQVIGSCRHEFHKGVKVLNLSNIYDLIEKCSQCSDEATHGLDDRTSNWVCSQLNLLIYMEY